jgi:hypothetical protein
MLWMVEIAVSMGVELKPWFISEDCRSQNLQNDTGIF